MNKIISISINGIIFNVDEHAYLTLKNYLDTLKLHFAKTEGREEILGDIEARIAEMLQERMKGKREAVYAEDVAAVIAAMGKPEDMGEAEENTAQSSATSDFSGQANPNTSRRVFRNPDDKVLGGVCSGIANYFDIDPIIPRLLFVVAFFGFGSGFLLYLILWIIIPEAKTPSEKLEMKGERVNVSNIEKTVKENLNDFKKKVNEWGEEVKNADTHKISGFFASLAHDLVRAFKPILRFIIKVAAIFLAIIGGIILFTLVVSLLGVSGVVAANLPDFIYDIFDSRNEMVMGSIGIALVFGTPVIALLYYTLRLIFNIKYTSRWIGFGLAIAWLAGFVMMSIVGVRTINNFGTEETLVENIPLKTNSKVLYLDVNKMKSGEYYFSYNEPKNKKLMKIKVNSNEIASAQLDIVKAENGMLELVKEYSAHGKNAKEARKNAASISYSFVQKNDSQLIFDEIFDIEKGNKWRAQDVNLTLKIPVGQIIMMQPGMENIIYDIDNTTNTYDGDMPGHKWLMTESGLTCLDCPKTEENIHEDWHEEENDEESHKSSYHTTLHIL